MPAFKEGRPVAHSGGGAGRRQRGRSQRGLLPGDTHDLQPSAKVCACNIGGASVGGVLLRLAESCSKGRAKKSVTAERCRQRQWRVQAATAQPPLASPGTHWKSSSCLPQSSLPHLEESQGKKCWLGSVRAAARRSRSPSPAAAGHHPAAAPSTPYGLALRVSSPSLQMDASVACRGIAAGSTTPSARRSVAASLSRLQPGQTRLAPPPQHTWVAPWNSCCSFALPSLVSRATLARRLLAKRVWCCSGGRRQQQGPLPGSQQSSQLCACPPWQVCHIQLHHAPHLAYLLHSSRCCTRSMRATRLRCTPRPAQASTA